MRGLLFNPDTGKFDSDAVVPPSGGAAAWLKEQERREAILRVKRQIDLAREFPGVKGTTTTNRYLSYPAAAAGISRASSGSSAWSFSAYTELVPVNTITATYYIAGFTWAWHTPAAAVDTTYEVLFEIATGATSSEVLVVQVPCSFRADTLVGYVPSNFVVFPEPVEIAANTRLSVRVAQSLATTSQTYSGIKIMYETA